MSKLNLKYTNHNIKKLYSNKILQNLKNNNKNISKIIWNRDLYNKEVKQIIKLIKKLTSNK